MYRPALRPCTVTSSSAGITKELLSTVNPSVDLFLPSKQDQDEPVSCCADIAINPSVFIVHGHDEAARETVARFVEKFGLKPIILREQPDGGNTIIEKFEHYSKASYAIVLLTPDDVGAPAAQTQDLHPRARQNVLFELGFFVGVLKRAHVCALRKDGVEIPSDIQGVLFIKMDDEDGWKVKLAGEMRNAGLPVDMNKLLRSE